MKTIIVYGTFQALHGALARQKPDLHASDKTCLVVLPERGFYAIQSRTDPSDVIHGIVIASTRDLDKLCSRDADVVIEDHSFDLYRWHLDGNGFPGGRSYTYDDVWGLWREFLQLRVLRP